VKVARLEGRGKMAAAVAKLGSLHWYRCVRRGVLRSYKKEREVPYLSMNAVIRTDGAVKMTKPPSGKRKEGELDLSSEEQTRIFNDAWLHGFCCSLICKERHRK